MLLSQQRYEMAAAMFALAGQLRDTARILLEKQRDVQLALFVCRLLDPRGPVLAAILRDAVLPLATHTHNRALASMAHWLLGEREQALHALVPRHAGEQAAGKAAQLI